MLYMPESVELAEAPTATANALIVVLLESVIGPTYFGELIDGFEPSVV
jgi:hypothetical protein